MFILEASQVATTFERFAAHFVEPSWLHPLAITAASDTLQSIRDRCTDDTPGPAITGWTDALRYEFAPLRAGPNEVAVAISWHSDLSPELFPERFDGDLRVERAGTTHCDLSIIGTYPRSKLPSVEPVALQHTTELWARLFLANIIRAFPEIPPPDQPVTRGGAHHVKR